MAITTRWEAGILWNYGFIRLWWMDFKPVENLYIFGPNLNMWPPRSKYLEFNSLLVCLFDLRSVNSLPRITRFSCLLHVYRKDAIEPTQSTAECRNNHARWVRDIDFSPTPKTSFVNWLWLGITAFREKMMSALLEFHSGILTSHVKAEIQQGHCLHSFCFLKKIVYREATLHKVGKLQKNSKKILTKSRFLHNWAEFQKKIDPIQNCISERSTFVDLTLLCMFLWSGMIIRSRAWKSCSEKFCFQKKVSKKNSYSEEKPFWKVLLEAIGSFFITYLQPH